MTEVLKYNQFLNEELFKQSIVAYLEDNVINFDNFKVRDDITVNVFILDDVNSKMISLKNITGIVIYKDINFISKDGSDSFKPQDILKINKSIDETKNKVTFDVYLKNRRQVIIDIINKY